MFSVKLSLLLLPEYLLKQNLASSLSDIKKLNISKPLIWIVWFCLFACFYNKICNVSIAGRIKSAEKFFLLRALSFLQLAYVSTSSFSLFSGFHTWNFFPAPVFCRSNASLWHWLVLVKCSLTSEVLVKLWPKKSRHIVWRRIQGEWLNTNLKTYTEAKAYTSRGDR